MKLQDGREGVQTGSVIFDETIFGVKKLSKLGRPGRGRVDRRPPTNSFSGWRRRDVDRSTGSGIVGHVTCRRTSGAAAATAADVA